MNFVIGLMVFLMCVMVIETGHYAFTTIRNPDRRKVQRRLRTISANDFGYKSTDILRKTTLSDIPWLNRILLSIPGALRLHRLLQQANVKYPLGFFIMLTMLLAVSGYYGVLLATRNQVYSAIAAFVLGCIPIFYIHSRKKQRMQKFQEQLPEALDLIARALKAGHAFPSGMRLAADEFDDPLGTEFENTLDEINFGVAVADALKSLASRVDCPDLRYFVVSVILQRETGGNLAEIIENIARLLRERFKFQGHVKTLAAEGKLSAIILTLFPFVLVLALHFINPIYIGTLVKDPIGKIMAAIAAFLMLLGIIFMKRMIKIKV